MELIGVHARYGRRGEWVLRDINAVVGAGQTVAVTGRNGAGKSTLLRVVAGLLRAAKGQVRDRPGDIGWMPERFPAAQPFTVRSYLDAHGRIRGLDRAERVQAIDQWTERLHLRMFLDERLPELSMGTARKVGLAQALLRRPGLLVLDEPWEGLDTASRAELAPIIDEVTGAGGSCVVTDHRGRAGELASDHWRLADGTLLDPDASDADLCVIEVVVPAVRARGTAERLRGDGHDVRTIRPLDTDGGDRR